MKKGITVVVLLLVTLLIIAGCGQRETNADENKNEATKQNNDPVTITVNSRTALTEADFQMLFVEPVKKKYPHITLKMTKDMKLEDIIASGDIPDIIQGWNGQAAEFKLTGLLEDITPLAKKHNIDLNRFDPVTLDAIKVASDKGELYGLPYKNNFNALYYNKDIFDKFGVNYPKDGMTWEDAIELGKKVTRNDGGVQYRGLDPQDIVRLAFPLSLESVDKNNVPHVNNGEWKKVFQLAHEIFSITGNNPPAKRDYNNTVDGFIKDQNVAMLGIVNLFPSLEEPMKKGLNWDLAQYPSYKEKPNVYEMVDSHYVFLSKTGKHKDAAMEVMKELTSDEVQSTMVRKTASASPLKNMKINEQLGAEVPFLKGKNVQAVFKSHYAPAPYLSPYYAKGNNILRKKFDEYIGGTKDLNTVLREAEEELKQLIAADLGK